MYLPYYVHLVGKEVIDCKNAESGKQQNKNAGLC
jgi:hypothetical protein